MICERIDKLIRQLKLTNAINPEIINLTVLGTLAHQPVLFVSSKPQGEEMHTLLAMVADLFEKNVCSIISCQDDDKQISEFLQSENMAYDVFAFNDFEKWKEFEQFAVVGKIDHPITSDCERPLLHSTFKLAVANLTVDQKDWITSNQDLFIKYMPDWYEFFAMRCVCNNVAPNFEDVEPDLDDDGLVSVPDSMSLQKIKDEEYRYWLKSINNIILSPIAADFIDSFERSFSLAQDAISHPAINEPEEEDYDKKIAKKPIARFHFNLALKQRIIQCIKASAFFNGRSQAALFDIYPIFYFGWNNFRQFQTGWKLCIAEFRKTHLNQLLHKTFVEISALFQKLDGIIKCNYARKLSDIQRDDLKAEYFRVTNRYDQINAEIDEQGNIFFNELHRLLVDNPFNELRAAREQLLKTYAVFVRLLSEEIYG